MFGTYKLLHKTPVINVKLNEVEKEQVYQYTYLGLLLDPTLT